MGKRVEHRVVNGEELKHCSACGQWKPLSDFYKCRDASDGLRAWCHACYDEHNLEAARRYRIAHREELREYNRRYYAAHREEAREYDRRRRAAHPERVREQNRRSSQRYRTVHHKEILARMRQRYAEKRAELAELKAAQEKTSDDDTK